MRAMNPSAPAGMTLSGLYQGAKEGRWHHFGKDTFEIGREEILIPGSAQMIDIYNPERTIAACFRLHSLIGYEIARDATREWLRRGGNPAKLMQIATQLPRARSPVLNALEMLT